MSADRWRHWEPPIEITAVEQGIWLPGGRTLGEFEITWPPEVVERFRAGYKCVNCMEPQEAAWPEHCSLCGYPMRSEQAAFFAREYGGERQINGKDWEAEIGSLDERRRKEEERARKDGQLR